MTKAAPLRMTGADAFGMTNISCAQDGRTGVNQKVRHRESPSEIAAETFRSISSGVL